MIEYLRSFLQEPRIRNINVDDNELLTAHRSILCSKPLLRSAFATFYQNMTALCDQFLISDGLEVELGSGAGFLAEVRPAVIASDVRKAPHIDMELDAQSMDLRADSVRCFYAINVFHHIPDPDKFFSELVRVLRPGGGCILVEPHTGFASSLLHRLLHKDEHFDPNASSWQTEAIGGPMSGANQALAHIVFERDREDFNSAYGDTLEVVHSCYALNGFRYLVSGGLNFRQLLPSFMAGPLASVERLIAFWAKFWSLHKITVLRRR